MGIKQSTSILVQTKKKQFFDKICCKFLAFFEFFAQKTLKMAISTSVWSGQHPKAGRNIQHPSHCPLIQFYPNEEAETIDEGNNAVYLDA